MHKSLKTQSLPSLRFALFVFVLFLAFRPVLSADGTAVVKPDILMIVVDDMNDWITLLDENAPIETPNLNQLAARGTLFTRAYCASPACNPSRVATLTGLRPTTTGVYGNRSNWRAAIPSRKTIMQRFRDAGYSVRGSGKIFHHHLDGAFHDDASFDDFQPMREQSYPPGKLNDAPDYGSRNTDWGIWPTEEADAIDTATADYAINQFAQPVGNQPLFLAVGFYKPHSPFFAPSAYHNLNAQTPLPLRSEADWDDLPSGATRLMKRTRWFWNGMQELDERKPGSYQQFIDAYAAAARFADAQIGRVLKALNTSDRKENTIVVLWSDHGFHLGEKDHIEKFSLWEKANRIPFIVAAPCISQPGTICDTPIDLTSLYPTMLELAGLPADDTCDGVSIVPLLKNPAAAWDRPALMTFTRGNHAVRSDRWRYIHYADGSEELYDHTADPNEWSNLADRPEHNVIKSSLRRWIPAIEANQVADMKPH